MLQLQNRLLCPLKKTAQIIAPHVEMKTNLFHESTEHYFEDIKTSQPTSKQEQSSQSRCNVLVNSCPLQS